MRRQTRPLMSFFPSHKEGKSIPHFVVSHSICSSHLKLCWIFMILEQRGSGTERKKGTLIHFSFFLHSHTTVKGDSLRPEGFPLLLCHSCVLLRCEKCEQSDSCRHVDGHGHVLIWEREEEEEEEEQKSHKKPRMPYQPTNESSHCQSRGKLVGEMLPFSITSVWGGGNVDDRRGAYRNCDRRQPVGWMTGRMNSSTGTVACSRQTRQMPTVLRCRRENFP